MKNTLISLVLMLSVISNTWGQPSKGNVSFIDILTTSKIEISSDVSKALSSHSYWKCEATYNDERMTSFAYISGFWFGKDGYFMQSISLEDLINSNFYHAELEEAIWSVIDNKTLLLEYWNKKETYRLITLKDQALVIEDTSGRRYYFSPVEDTYSAPGNLKRMLESGGLSVSNLRQEIKDKRKDQEDKLNTIVKCNNFSEGLALVAIDPLNKWDESNFGAKKKYGYINNKGTYDIQPTYDIANDFSDGFALVTLNLDRSKKWFFINKKGENAFNKEFYSARSFSEGFAAVELEGGYFFINKSGNNLSKNKYQEVGDFREGIAKVKFQDKWGFIDTTGKEIILPQFIYASDFSTDLALVGQFINNYYTQYNYVDKLGNIKIKIEENSSPVFQITKYGGGMDHNIEFEPSDFHNNYTILANGRTMGNNFNNLFYMDKEGKRISKGCTYSKLYHFSEGLALAKKYNMGYINQAGKWEIEPIYEEAGHFHEGLAKVKINDNWGFIDKDGKVVINKHILKGKTEIQTTPAFENVSDFSEGFAVVQVRGKFGYIDKSGKWLLNPELDKATTFKNGIAMVKMPGRRGWNYIDKTGKMLFTNFL